MWKKIKELFLGKSNESNESNESANFYSITNLDEFSIINSKEPESTSTNVPDVIVEAGPSSSESESTESMIDSVTTSEVTNQIPKKKKPGKNQAKKTNKNVKKSI